MYVMIVEKRISAQIKDRGRSAPDWYILLAVAIPFAPPVGFEMQLKEEWAIIKLTKVVYNPNNATFLAQTAPILHPKPDAPTVAQNLVNTVGWDIAVEEETLKKAIVTLRKKAVRELQDMLMKAQSRIVMAGAPLGLNPLGPGRRKR